MKQQKTEYGESSSKQGGATEGKKEKKNVQRLAGPQEFCSAGECSTTVLQLLPSIKLVRVMRLSGSAESCFSNWRHSLNTLTLVASGVLAS